MQEGLPRVNGSIYKPNKVATFKGFILQESPDVIEGFRIVRANSPSISFVHDVHGLTMNLRRPGGLHGSTQPPNMGDMPEDYSLFQKPTRRELLANRRPGPNDLSALTWTWPRKSEGDDWRWDLKFLLASQGHTLDDGLWALGLTLPREVKLDDKLSGFQPEDTPLNFLSGQDVETSEEEA